MESPTSAGSTLVMFVGFLLLLLTGAIGTLLGWWLTRRGVASQVEQATQRSQAENTTALAIAQERIRSLDEQHAALQAENLHQSGQIGDWREALERVRQEKTQIAERVLRLPVVEAQLNEAQELHRNAGVQLSQAHTRIATLESESSRIAPLQTEAKQAHERNTALQAEIASLRQDTGRLQAEWDAAKANLSLARQELATLHGNQNTLRNESARLQTLAGETAVLLEAERQQSQEKLQLLVEAREALGNQFKTLANEILEEKSQRFADQNKNNLGTLLEPLRLQINEFKGKVEQCYDTEGKERSALSAEVRSMMALNQTLSADTQNLTKALKGNSKMQGDWGEMILERVLEASGLRRGHEYAFQENFQRDGENLRPDVVINLPGDRRLVVDAKVSLLAYDESIRSETDELRMAACKRHTGSIRTHIHGLSAKRYAELLGSQSLDFVLLFVPIESALALALNQDANLQQEALKKNVLLVTPVTLMLVVRLVEQLWKQEKQRANFQAIAERGGLLYDKFHSFVKELEDIGKHLGNAQMAYEKSFRLLKTGPGNAIGQAEKLRELGVHSNKNFSAAVLEGLESVKEVDTLKTPASTSQATPAHGVVLLAEDLAQQLR